MEWNIIILFYHSQEQIKLSLSPGADRSATKCLVASPLRHQVFYTSYIYIYTHTSHGQAEWVEHPPPVLGDQRIRRSLVWIQTSQFWILVESNQWLQNWHVSPPSLVLGIIRIGQGLVDSLSDNVTEQDSRSWCQWSGVPVRWQYKVAMSVHDHKLVYVPPPQWVCTIAEAQLHTSPDH